MNVIQKFFCYLCCCVLIQQGVYAQLNQHSTDPTQFVAEMKALFAKTPQEKSTAIIEEFAKNSGGIAADKMQSIIKHANAMAEKKMRPIPHYADYFQVINAFMKSGKFDQRFAEWQKVLDDVTQKTEKARLANYDKFMDFSVNFFTNGNLSQTSGKAWNIQTTDYHFSIQDNKPQISFVDGTLSCFAARDTIALYDTKGDYSVFDQRWVGKSGKVTWNRVGLDPNSIYAELGKYAIDFTQTEYKVEDVTFYHKKYFNRPLKGVFNDKISSKIEGEYIYPQFNSYELDLQMKNFDEQVVFSSGFAMQGNKVLSFGPVGQPAIMNVYSKEKKLIMSSRSTGFVVREGSTIRSQAATSTIYFATDSIYHPRLTVDYNIKDKELRLIRDNSASSKIAFISSYHQLEGNVDGIFWKINTPVLDFKMVSQLKNLRVVFESFNLYEPKREQAYRAYSDVDVLGKLKDYPKGGQWELTADEFAAQLGNFKGKDITATIFQLVEDGFIYYNPETKVITVREKTVHYFDSRKGDADFDRIALVSESDQENAQLDLESKILLVTGVKRIGLSDSQKVTIFPKGGITRVKKNRDMDVDGTIVGGNVDFTGKNFAFKYDDFKVNLDSVDQMQIYLVDETGKRKTVDGDLAPVGTLIRGVTGTLFIDKNDNKSGKVMLPSYPRFESNGNSYLYYNQKALYNGAYKADTFYFKLDPFKFNDLDDIAPEALTFPGTMVAGNIFPAFKQTTSLQEDFSLGFTKNTQSQAMPTYGKGTFTGTITMSNKGLIGDGKIEYAAGGMTSKEFIFLPDSLMAEADSFYLQRKVVKNVEYPEAHNGKVRLRWYPAGDSLLVYMKERQFEMFAGKATLKGNLLVTDKGLRGAGTVTLPEATIRASAFNFTGGSFKSDSSDVVIKNKDAARVSFNSYNVKSRVDLDKMLGEFLANGKNIPIALPYNQYKTLASEFYWLMNDKIVNIRMPEDTAGGYFVSTHPQQDGLKFKASGGVVNLAENTIKVDGVPYIAIGDAKIQPPDTQVFIEKDAVIRNFEGATIVADSTSEMHKITKAKVSIKGKNEMTASGDYRYRGKNMKKQQVTFDPITIKKDEKDEKRFYTYATAKIDEKEGFKLNNKIDYKGECILDSRKKYLYFDGFAKLSLDSKKINAQWFKFIDEINPDNITIDVTAPTGEFKDTLYFGILQDMESLSPYPAFLTKKRTPLDPFLFRATGNLNNDAEKNTYKVGSTARIAGGQAGNVLTLKDSEGIVDVEGRYTFGGKWNLVEIAIGGRGTYNTNDSSFVINDAVMGLEYMFDKAFSQKVGDIIRTANGNGQEIDYTKPGFSISAMQLIDEKDVSDFKKMMGQSGYLANRMKGLDQTLILTNLNFVFDSATHTLRTKGRFGVAFSGEKYVNRMVDGFVEIGLRQSGDFLNIYIETDKDDLGKRQWLFWNYQKNVMQFLSSDALFNDQIAKLSEKKRTREKDGKVYSYTIAPMMKKNQFLYIMRGEAIPEDAPPPPPPTTPTDSTGTAPSVTPDGNNPTNPTTPDTNNPTPPPVPDGNVTPPSPSVQPDGTTPEVDPDDPLGILKDKKKKKKKKGDDSNTSPE